MDPRERFSATVADYVRYRPDYPEALFDWWLAQTGLRAGARVLDVGCGTGIASRQLAARGLDVVGLDPNQPMLEAARAAGGGIDYRLGDVETLPVDGPFDAIVGGQAFHWFDLDVALPRLRSALAEGGRIMAFWNLRDETDAFMCGYEQLLLEHSPEYASVGAEPKARAVAAHPTARDVDTHTVAHQQSFDLEGFLGRVWSSSYVRHSVTDRARFDAALTALFEAHAQGGAVTFRYRTWALLYR